jgi:hypothetical protein
LPPPFPRTAWAIVLGAAPVHLALALSTDLSPDEAYYLCAARRAGGYIPDHPPLLPWMLRLSDGLTSLPVELRVRLWPIALSLATAVALVELARRRGAGREGCLLAAWAGAWALLPMAGGFVATPDGPVLLAIAVGLLLVGDRPGVGSLLGAGAALAVGALAKVVALPVAVALAAGTTGWRRKVALLAPFLLVLPWLLPSLRFQLHHAFGAQAPAGWTVAGALGAVLAAGTAQAALWSPWFFLRGMKGLGQMPAGDRLVAFGLTGLVLASALLRAVPPEPNWWAPAAMVVVAAAARSAGELSARGRLAVVATLVIPTLIAAAHTAHPFLPIGAERDPTARMHGWRNPTTEPISAPGVGPYGPAAERCVYRNECDEIDNYFR